MPAQSDLACFAQIDALSCTVLNTVLVACTNQITAAGSLQSQAAGQQYLQKLFGPNTVWLQSDNLGWLRRPASLGYRYAADWQAWVRPAPGPDWLPCAETADWQAPVPYPAAARDAAGRICSWYDWHSSSQSWVWVRDLNPAEIQRQILPVPATDFAVLCRR